MPEPGSPLPSQSDAERLQRAIAEVGSMVCCYMPGAGDPDAWPTSRCDCKYGQGPFAHEQTGCPELRDLYRRACGEQPSIFAPRPVPVTELPEHVQECECDTWCGMAGCAPNPPKGGDGG